MKKLVFSFVVGVAFAGVAGTVPSGYVTDGLVACWDAIDNVGTGSHDGSATSWVDLVAGRAFALNKTVWSADYLMFDGTKDCGGTLADTSVFEFDSVVTARTVEVVFKYAGSGTSGIVLMGSTASGLSVGRNGSSCVNSTAGSDNKANGVQPVIGTEPVTLSYGYINRRPVAGHLYHENTSCACTGSNDAWFSPDANVYLGRRASNSSSFVGSVCAVRVYDRLLSANEVAANTNADTARFSLKQGGTVVSGSVSVDDVTYAAGERIPYPATGVLTVQEATDAKIVLSSVVPSVALTAGTLALADGGAVLKTIGNLSLGASAKLKLTGNGLQVTGTVSADASATVAGPGVFVATDASTPVALTDGATYVSSRGTSAGWPSGGVACLPVGTSATIATAADVAAVQNLTGIVFLNDGTDADKSTLVTYTSATALSLSARLQGRGSFQSVDAGSLTISGDNSALVSPGHFYFTNSPVVVSHQAGLGARATGPAVCYFNTRSTLDFVCENGVFTNEAPLHVNSRPGSGKLRIGVSPRTGRLVQHNSFKHLLGSNSGDNTVYVDGTLEFLDCDIAVTWKFLYFGASGGTSHLWYTGNCTYHESYATFMYDGNLKIHFNGTSNFGAGQVLTSNAFCEGPDVLKDAYLMPWSDAMILDLQGFDQKVLRFENAYGAADKKRRIHSDRPAMLTTTGNTAITHSLMFTGAAGYCHANTATETIQNYVSTSTNLLEVAKGTVLFKSGAGWNGDAVVRSGATLEVDSACALTNKVRSLVVDEGGALVVRAGAGCTLRAVTIAGTSLPAGASYTVKKLRDEMGLPVDGDDLGMVTVAGSAEWGGWPTEPGARAFVPMDTTVYASDDDVANIAGLGEIYLSSGSRAVFTNETEVLNLSAKISGLGVFEARNSAGVVLAGNNAELVSPGTFFFTNSYVVVSNRYGLGSSVTEMVTYYYGDLVDSLRFGGEGLTNDVAIWCYPGTKSGCFVIGPDHADEDLVFNNSFRFRGGSGNNAILFRNRVHFRGGIFGTVNQDGQPYNHIYSSRKGNSAEVWLEGDVKAHFYYWR